MAKTYHFFKREWTNLSWYYGAQNEYIKELRMEDFIDDADQYRIRVQQISWKHDMSADVKGTAFEWIPELNREEVIDRLEANDLFKRVQRTKYTTQKIPAELTRYIR